MGLDMYLTAHKYLSKYVGQDKKEELEKVFPESTGCDFITFDFQIGSWRKANAIHNWFVRNAQNGEDDCKKAYVDRNQLKHLRKLCQEVLDKSVLVEDKVENGYAYKDGKKEPIYEDGQKVQNPEVAESILPTGDGFFFGSTNYDQWYIEDIKLTIEIIDKCLNLSKDWDFYYQSSW